MSGLTPLTTLSGEIPRRVPRSTCLAGLLKLPFQHIFQHFTLIFEAGIACFDLMEHKRPTAVSQPLPTNLWEDCFHSRSSLFWVARFQLEVLSDEIVQEILLGNLESMKEWHRKGRRETWMSEYSSSLIPTREQTSNSLLSLVEAWDASSIRGKVVLKVLGGGLRRRSGLKAARVVSGEKYRWIRWPLVEVRVQTQGIRAYRTTWLNARSLYTHADVAQATGLLFLDKVRMSAKV